MKEFFKEFLKKMTWTDFINKIIIKSKKKGRKNCYEEIFVIIDIYYDGIGYGCLRRCC